MCVCSLTRGTNILTAATKKKKTKAWLRGKDAPWSISSSVSPNRKHHNHGAVHPRALSAPIPEGQHAVAPLRVHQSGRAPPALFINKVIHKLWDASSVCEVQVVLVMRELKDRDGRWPLTQDPLTLGWVADGSLGPEGRAGLAYHRTTPCARLKWTHQSWNRTRFCWTSGDTVPKWVLCPTEAFAAAAE